MHRQFSARNEDAGFTLIEVVVAMLVFAIIATGFLMTLTAGMVTTRDTRTRIVAANLASQQIDLIRSQNALDVENRTRDITLNGDTFHVKVAWQWQTSTGAATSCEAGIATGSLAYKRITVEVTWDNMPAGSRPVYSDTALAPRTKLSDPNLGTILVGVVDAAGVGVSGATVSLSPANGIASVTTDSDGCAYLLKVPPAENYSVSISKSGYVNERQVENPSASVNVAAGSTSRTSFAYDKAATYTVRYANNVASAVTLPTNLTTTFISTYGNAQLPSTTKTNPKTFSLYPISSGYSIVSGAYAETPENAATTCLAPDPGEWLETATLVGKRPDAVGATATAPASVSVPMGVIKITGLSGSNKFLTAVYEGGGAGDPGCGFTTKPKYTFDDSTISSNTAIIALPYGTWKIYRGSTSGSVSTSGQITGGMTPLTIGAVTGTGTATIVTLDPRVAP